MTKIPVGVLLPLYNGDRPDWFRQSLNSIICQRKISQYEVRIYLGIDGPIKHELEEIVNEYCGKIYYIARQEVRRGLANNLNNIISMLKDEIFIFRVDSDDICEKYRFYYQLSYLIKYKKIDIIGTFMININEEGEKISAIIKYPKNHSKIVKYFPFGNPMAHSTVAMRVSALKKIGLYHVNWFPEDLNLWYRAASMNCIFHNIPLPLVRFRIPSDFAKKRGRNWAVREFKTNYFGLRSVGLDNFIVLPFIRYLFRYLPSKAIRMAYRFREKINEA